VSPPEKMESTLAANMPCIINKGMHILKQINCLEEFIITGYAQNISLLLLNKFQLYEKIV
jgi:hypothetical protein